MKRIVLCFDGTWCTPADESIPEAERTETNVRRFYRSIAPTGRDGVPQVAWYNPGVGTSMLNAYTGGAFGVGLDLHILDGYSYLVQTYESGDEVYLLGFSRGAYTARSLVGMIRNCGLVEPSFSNWQVGIAYGIYRTRGDRVDSEVATAFRRTFAREIEIQFVGLWDTVGSLGLPISAIKKLASRYYQFHDLQLSKIVRSGSQALALDEHRADFDVCLWEPSNNPGQDVEQRWFPGSHSDIGGGCVDRRLSDLSLRWMQERAALAGLSVEPVRVADDAYRGAWSDSYAEFLGGFYAYTHPEYFRPVMTATSANERVDSAVDLRRRAIELRYNPRNPGLPVLKE